MGRSDGYHKMMRWYAIKIWPLLSTMGYTWAWRLDDDSFIISPIPYNIFAFMEHYNYDYAYRNIITDVPGALFWDFLRSFVIEHGITTIDHLMDSCEYKGSIFNFTLSNCGIMPGYYNNLFVTNVSRWLEPDVQALLTAFDDSGMIFLEQWGDLNIQSAVVRLLFDESKIHRFVGWGYSHMSTDPSNPHYGIVQTGFLDPDPFETLEFFAEDMKWTSVDSSMANYYEQLTYAYDRLLSVTKNAPCGSINNIPGCLC